MQSFNRQSQLQFAWTKALPAQREHVRLSRLEVVESLTSRLDALAATLKRSRFMTCVFRGERQSGAVECWNPASVAHTISRSPVCPDSVCLVTCRLVHVTSLET